MTQIDSTPYSEDEMKGTGEIWPKRGARCPCCNAIIPQFANLTRESKDHVLALILAGQSSEAVAYLVNTLFCPQRWAQIWVMHRGSVTASHSSTPCPYCGEPLYDTESQQCPQCKMWLHNADNSRYLGSEE